MLTLLTVHDVYEITPVQDTGGLAELMTLLCAERTTATHTLTTINDRGQVPRGRVHLVCISNQDGGSAGGGSTTVRCWRLRKATTNPTHPVQVGSISTRGMISSTNVGRSKG